MRRFLGPALLVPALVASACVQEPPAPRTYDTLDMTTWSIIAADPITGDVGVAMASCVRGTVADALAALVPGKGVSATQAGFDLRNRNRTFEALKAGKPADSVILA